MLSRVKRAASRATSRANRCNLESLESRWLFAIAVAENLLVDIDATKLAPGTGNDIHNAGTLGGVFEATGIDPSTTTPVIGQPVPTATAGTVGIRFDGTDFLQLVDAPGGGLITAPEGITGPNPTASIEAWVWNPGIPDEETMVSWGHRGGPDGTNMSFNYGGHNLYGAVGHWGAPDAGWGPPNGPQAVPAAKQWHHLVYTFDGSAQHLYVDGSLLYTEDLTTTPLNTWPDTPINLATQMEPDGVTPTAGLRGSLTLGRVRIHDGVLTDAQVAANYNAEKADFIEPVVPPPPPAPAELLVSVDATTLPEGTQVQDIPDTGPLDGVFEATGGGDTVPVIDTPIADATAGTRGIVLDGNDYLQLVTAANSGTLLTAPSSITGLDAKASIETWVWNPSIADEETQVAWGKRGGPDGTNMSFNYGANANYGAVGHWGSPDIGWGTTVPAAQHWHHLVYTFDGDTTRVYADGQLANSEVLGPGVINTAPDTPINLGSQTEADGVSPTPGLRGSLTLGKVRIYKGVLTDQQILDNFNNEKASFIEPTLPPAPANLLVSIDATNLPAGPVTSVPNSAPQGVGGAFTPTGGGGTTPVIAPPLTGSDTGTRGIRLDGNDYLQLTDGTGSIITAPASITGPNPKESIEAWVYNPGVANEETMVSWGNRGGPDGSNNSFNYGSNGSYGAMGHWGNQDEGWGPSYPAARQWHLVAYTYDGLTQRVYIDGQMTDSEALGNLNIHPDTPINIGTQLEADGVTPTQFLKGSLTLGKVRIYEGVLTDAQIAANYNGEKAAFVNPTDPAPTSLTSGPIHRYSFNNAAGDATGATIKDLVGTADGTVQGAGATFNGSRLVLPGGSSDVAAYVDLPNGLLSNLGAANGGTGKLTFEGWAKNTGNQSWSRFYDFGSSAAGEITGPGGGPSTGVDFFMLTAQTGGDSIHRFETNDANGNQWDEVTSPTNQDLHFAVTWDEASGQVKYYENGKEVGGEPSGQLMSAIADINNWLGRSQFTADANLQGEYDEFRIYDHVLTAGEVAGDFQAGPDVVTSNAPQVSAVYVHGSTWLGEDNNATNTTFGELLQAQGLGDKNLGYRVDTLSASTASIIPWINANEVVLRYSGPVSGAGVPTAGSILVHGQKQDYTVQSVTALDPQTYVLRLGAPLGGAGTAASNGDRITLTVNGAGPGGTNYTTKINVVQGDVNKSGSVLANDYSEVKARFFKNTNSPTTGTNDYSPFHDVDGSGSILANDYSAVKARFFQSLPAPPAAAAAALTGSGVTRDLFSNAAIL